MANVWSTKNMPLVRSTAEQSMQRAAEAQAAMYSNLGQALGKVGNAYFEKKEEDKQIDAIVRDERILNMIYRDKTDEHGNPVMPSDLKEVRSDVKALYKGMGGRKGIEQLMRLDSAEQRAIAAEQRAQSVFNKAEQQDLDTKAYFQAITTSQPTITREKKEVGRIGGGTVGDMYPFLVPSPEDEPRPTTGIGLAPSPLTPDQFDQNPFLLRRPTAQPTAQPDSSYASELIGNVRSGLDSARSKLAEVEIPEVSFAKEEITTKPGTSLLAQSENMTGQAWLEALQAQNPDMTAGMMRMALQTASAMPQREPSQYVSKSDGRHTWLVNERNGEIVPGSVSLKPTLTTEEFQEVQNKDAELESALGDIGRVMDIFKVDAKGNSTGEASEWLVGPNLADKGSRFLAKMGVTGFQSDKLLNDRDFLNQFLNTTILSKTSKLTGQISDKDLELLRDTAPTMNSNPSEWGRFITKMNGMVTKERARNSRLFQALRSADPTEPIRDKSPDDAYNDIVKGGFLIKSKAEQQVFLEELPNANLHPHVIEEVSKRLIESGKEGLSPIREGEGKGEGSKEIKVGEVAFPSVESILNSKDPEGQAEIIQHLSSVMLEALTTGGMTREDFKGTGKEWYGKYPDPLRAENYKILLEYAQRSGVSPPDTLALHPPAHTTSHQPRPWLRDRDLFERLEELRTLGK